MTLGISLLLLALGGTANPVSIPMGGNSWVINGGGARVTPNGVEGWSAPGSVVRTWFRVDRPGTLVVSVSVVGPGAASEIAVSLRGTARTLHVRGSTEAEYPAGTFHVDAPGYIAVDLTGLEPVRVIQWAALTGLARLRRGTTTSRSQSYGERGETKHQAATPVSPPPC